MNSCPAREGNTHTQLVRNGEMISLSEECVAHRMKSLTRVSCLIHMNIFHPQNKTQIYIGQSISIAKTTENCAC